MIIEELSGYAHGQATADGMYTELNMHGHRITIGDKVVTILASEDEPTVLYWDVYDEGRDELVDWRELGPGAVGF